MSCVTDGLLNWVNAANNASLFVEGRNVNEESIVNLQLFTNQVEGKFETHFR